MPEETNDEMDVFLSDVLEDLNTPEISSPGISPAPVPTAADEIAARDREIDRLKQEQAATVIGFAVKEAVREAGGNYTLLAPHLSQNLALQETDGARAIVLTDESGAPRLREDGAAMTLADRLSELQKTPEMAAAFSPAPNQGTGINRTGFVSHQQPIRAYDQAAVNAHIADIAAGRVRVTL